MIDRAERAHRDRGDAEGHEQRRDAAEVMANPVATAAHAPERFDARTGASPRATGRGETAGPAETMAPV